jgi:tetratricopeptide (TPR) repeat protein
LLEALGDIKRRVGESPESLRLYEEAALVLADGGDGAGEERARGKAALSAITVGDLGKASGLIQKTLGTMTVDSPKRAISNTYYQLSQLHWHSAQHGEALAAAEKALDAALSSGDVEEETHAYEALALTCHSRGDWQMGIEYELKRDALGVAGFDSDEALDAHL